MWVYCTIDVVWVGFLLYCTWENLYIMISIWISFSTLRTNYIGPHPPLLGQLWVGGGDGAGRLCGGGCRHSPLQLQPDGWREGRLQGLWPQQWREHQQGGAQGGNGQLRHQMHRRVSLFTMCYRLHSAPCGPSGSFWEMPDSNTGTAVPAACWHSFHMFLTFR